MQVAMQEDVCLEQFGDLEEYLKIKHEVKVLEENINKQLAKDKKSKYSVMKAIFVTN